MVSTIHELVDNPTAAPWLRALDETAAWLYNRYAHNGGLAWTEINPGTREYWLEEALALLEAQTQQRYMTGLHEAVDVRPVEIGGDVDDEPSPSVVGTELDEAAPPRTVADATADDIGRSVIYTAHPGAVEEEGVITDVVLASTSSIGAVLFVRFAGDLHAKACYPRDLEWSHPEKETP